MYSGGGTIWQNPETFFYFPNNKIQNKYLEFRCKDNNQKLYEKGFNNKSKNITFRRKCRH